MDGVVQLIDFMNIETPKSRLTGEVCEPRSLDAPAQGSNPGTSAQTWDDYRTDNSAQCDRTQPQLRPATMAGDDAYFEAMAPGSLAERLGIRARRNMYRTLLTLHAVGPETRIVDVGVSDVETDAANLFEKLHPYPQNITACGLTSAALPDRVSDKVAFQKISPGAPLPFDDATFDLFVSNAVLEHVGTPGDHKTFIREAARVAKSVFITVPNRFFPVEHHTGIPLLHFWPQAFRTVCRQSERQETWSDPRVLSFFSNSSLLATAQSALPDRSGIRTGYSGIWYPPFASNLFLSIDG